MAFGVLIGIAIVAVWLFAIFDAITAETEKVRNLQKPLWVLIVLLVPLGFGAIAWFAWGRPQVGRSDGGGSGWGSSGWGGGSPGPRGPFGGGGGRNRRPIAPDDDPDFLKSL